MSTRLVGAMKPWFIDGDADYHQHKRQDQNTLLLIENGQPTPHRISPGAIGQGWIDRFLWGRRRGHRLCFGGS